MPSQKELSDLRAAYLSKREAALINGVNDIAITLYDKIFEKYLIALEQSDGKLVYNKKNLNMIQGLDAIYKDFNKADNIPVIKGFFNDLNGITPLNESYFKNIAKKELRAEAKVVKAITDKQLGLKNGQPVAKGFADSFINDKMVLKAIKKQTTKAISSGQSFQTFREQLKTTIVGAKDSDISGKLQQYYRNYAYDTLQKVDRLNQDLFAKELGLRYFIWAGGLVAKSRPLCRLCNGKIVDRLKFAPLKFSDLKKTKVLINGKYVDFRAGLDENWAPMLDLGQYACRHTKNYIADSVANQLKSKWLDISLLKG